MTFFDLMKPRHLTNYPRLLLTAALSSVTCCMHLPSGASRLVLHLHRIEGPACDMNGFLCHLRTDASLECAEHYLTRLGNFSQAQ